MAHSAQPAATASLTHRNLRVLAWPAALLLALIAGLWLAPTTARAGTITIIDGPNTPPTANGVYTDGYIEAQLAASSLTITTTGVVTGPNEIRVLQGVTITWSTGNQLTLDAGSSIVISGTIQHDGPANGAGGLRLLASAAPTGTVTVGTGTQTTGVAAGSRHGLTRVSAGNLVLQGGSSGTNPFALLGFRALNQGAAYTVTGAISVTVSQNVTASAGTANFAYVQVGHGGGDATSEAIVSGNFSGPIAVAAGGDVTFQGGTANFAYAQLGNGGFDADGSYSGNHSLSAGDDVTFQAGDGQHAYAHLGNGGTFAIGNRSGNHSLDAGGDVTFQAGGGGSAYAQLGNGGTLATGSHSGNHSLSAGGDVTFRGGTTNFTYAHLGNGGAETSGSHSGDHTLDAGGDVTFQAGNFGAYAQLGNGGLAADGSHSGNHRLSAGGDVTFQAGGGGIAYAHLGNGGFEADDSYSGNHSLSAGGDVTFRGGTTNFTYAHLGNGGAETSGSHGGDHTLDAGGDVTFQAGGGSGAYAQLGNGGWNAEGSQDGRLTLTTTGSLTLTRGNGTDAYAIIGHGSDVRTNPINQSRGSRSGDITLRIGATGVFSGSQVGHITANGAISVTAGNTLIGVSQNDPFTSGAGQLLVTGVISSGFSSAPTANGGELRIYLPRADSQQIPTSATFNGSSFATANTIPLAQLAGFAQFGDGPYLPDYSFYLGGQPDMAIVKRATPAGPLAPGDQITYTIAFSNTGNVTATQVVFSDSLPSSVIANGYLTMISDGLLTITESSGLPDLVIEFSALRVGGPVEVVITGTVQNAAVVLGTTFTNTATITATGDITLSNNAAAVARSVIPGATLIVTKTVVGAAPAGTWQFSGSGDIGDFSLPAAGGSREFTPLIPGPFTLTETTQAGYTSTVACTTGASGTNSVQVALSSGQQVGCTFTNTEITQTLTVDKVVVGGTLAADNFPLFIDGAPISRGVPKLLATGAHTVTETSVPSYTASFGGACNAGGQVNLASGAHLTCTITNTYITQTLTIDKVVAGGPLDADDFDLFVDGSPVTRGAANLLSAGQHTVTETGVPTYTAAFGGACNAAGVVNLAIGGHVTCTITNTYVPPITQTLTVNKVVVGGPLEADDFDLFVDGAPVSRGTANLLSAGQHTVSETSVSTYTAAFGGACNSSGVVNLGAGTHVTCTITNTYTPEPPQTGGVVGLVYVDDNHNQQPDTGEPLPGVTVTLQSETGVAAGLLTDLTDVTDNHGEYGFADVPAGDYTLRFAVPTGFESIGDAPVTVTPGQTTTVPDQVTVRVLPHKVYMPLLRDLNPEPPPTE